ncbi:37S ribosomal protein mrp51, mitochondrial [Cytospora mali]|uniref:37S ribosomal protein mrp51, mitochondrial n=1 Tax=Cytospora mali TaxID=578113 RepID=A0A194VXN3_CYTMA|nr:37S ribosomal protein mrp51, mitochondrial [Valsa mali]
MATAGRTLSPGGALLRASRMFSLPQAIPPPPGDYQAATSYNSETATQGFPTLQTVTVPENFRQRGDWGFKRNFPMRSTARTSTPYLRIKQVDSIEHVTDFASAADHTLSLEKWQEMNIPISLPHTYGDAHVSITKLDMRPQSVFENKYDFTAIDEEKISQSGQMRWKYKGPWLAKLSEGEFQKYIKKVVRPRRGEFRQYLREQLAQRLTQRARAAAVRQGGDEAAKMVLEVQVGAITDDHITDFLRELRGDRQSLFELIGKFLDLAPIEPPDALDWMGTLAPDQSKTTGPKNPYAVYGPPITHPSAGLSYLRTGAFLENHPIYGPLKEHRPIKARVVGTKTEVHAKGPKVGVGGFIANSNLARLQFNTKQDRFDPTAKGGVKVWVNYSSAQVNSQGRVLLSVDEADTESKLVEEEMQGEKRVFHAEPEDYGRQNQLLKAPKSSSKLERRIPLRVTTQLGSRRRYGLES